MTTIRAETILRSRNTARPDKIVSTLLCRYPRWIHAELMTHRQFSRNAASSRAIPVNRMIASIREDPAIPLYWGKNQKGMQATEECNEMVNWVTVDGRVGHMSREGAWGEAMERAIELAVAYSDAGYHKQVVNRLVEPFMHITVLISSTEWSNFIALRDHPAAEPHIAMLAREIRRELERTDNIQDLDPGEWHLPFTSEEDKIYYTPLPYEARNHQVLGSDIVGAARDITPIKMLITKSVACCASTSYKTVEGFEMTMETAHRIHDSLLGSHPVHASPAEHVCQADDFATEDRAIESYGGDGPTLHIGWQHEEEHGNFEGFRQYRKMLPNECL